MTALTRAGRVLAHVIPFVLCLGSAAPISAAEAGWRDARSLPDIVAALEGWLDAQSGYAPAGDAPAVRIVSRARLAAVNGVASRVGPKTRGLYDPETATVYLVRPWDPRRAEDVSVLLHELVHHRQRGARHWYCPGAQEPDAYALQESWLAAEGATLAFNRIAVVLEAGCTRRDIHPD